MNIIDMNFDQLMTEFNKRKYNNRFMPNMAHYIGNNNELRIRYEALIAMLSNFQDIPPSDAFDIYDNAIQRIPELCSDYIVLTDISDPLFSETSVIYVHIYLYLKLVSFDMLVENGFLTEDIKVQMQRKNIRGYLYRFLKKHQYLTVVYLLARIDFEANDCQHKSVGELNPDQCLIYAQKNKTDLNQIDDILEAVIEINPQNPLIKGEINNVLANLYFEKEDYVHALKYMQKVSVSDAIEGKRRSSYAMLGDVDDFYLKLKGLEIDEQEMHYLLFLLAINADPGKYGGAYSSLVNCIKKKYSEMAGKDFYVHSISERRIETRDENYFYIMYFKYITEWVMRVKEFKTALALDAHLSESSYANPMHKYEVFDLMEDDLKKDLQELVSCNGIYDNNALYVLYKKYYDRLYTDFSEDLGDFLKYFYQIGLGTFVYERTINLLSAPNVSSNTSIKKKMAFLLTTAYIDSHRNQDNRVMKSLKDMFPQYGINPDNVSNKLYRIDIYDSLSENGKYEYKSACLQYDLIKSANYNNCDAGMLSMSFYRIIENESNVRIWEPVSLKMNFNTITRIMNDHCHSLTRPEKDRFNKRWNRNLETIKNMADAQRNGTLQTTNKLMFGQLRILMNCLHQSDPVAVYVKSFFLQQLTPYGQSEFNNNTFDEWYSGDRINAFRNPPAHNRYVHLDTAIKSKEYVETQLIKMSKMLIL